jgi:hypothetical protein
MEWSAGFFKPPFLKFCPYGAVQGLYGTTHWAGIAGHHFSSERTLAVDIHERPKRQFTAVAKT